MQAPLTIYEVWVVLCAIEDAEEGKCEAAGSLLPTPAHGQHAGKNASKMRLGADDRQSLQLPRNDQA